MSKFTKTNMAAGILLLLIAVSLGVTFYIGSTIQPSLSVIPGFEGLHGGVEGVEIQSSFFKLGQSLPSGYRWLDSSPKSAALEADLDQFDMKGTVIIEVGDPRETSDLFTVPRSINYWVKEGETYVHVKGDIIIYIIPVTFNSKYTGSSLSHIFKGEKMWFTLTSIAWNRAVQEQSPISGSTGFGTAWEAPLQAVIDRYRVDDLGSHYYLEPREQGRSFTLYSSPSQQGTISDLLSGDVNSTFAGDTRPDTRLSSSAFFCVTLTDFGETNYPFLSYTPTAEYMVKVYALRIGKFTYTNMDDTPWAQRKPEDNWWNQVVNNTVQTVGDILGNPFFWLVIIIGMIVLILWFLGPLIAWGTIFGVGRAKK
jgi:hypothetical protein